MATAFIASVAINTQAAQYDDWVIPGKWLRPLLPEKGDEPDYPEYDKNNALEQARDQVWAGQYRRALLTLSPLKKSLNVDVVLLRGESQLNLGRYDDAMQTLAAPAIARKAEIEILRARVLAAQGGYSSAVGIVQRVIDQQPELIAPHFYLGQFSESLGDTAGAVAAYSWFVSAPHNKLEEWLGHPETFDKAEDVTFIGRAIDRWATLTLAYQRDLQLHNVVLNMFVRAYDQIDRGYWPAHLAAAQAFYSHDDSPSAMDELHEAITANPSDIASWALFGRIQLQQFNFSEADKAVDQIRAVDQDSVAGDLIEARNYLLQRMPKLAMPALERALARQPRNVEALGLLAGAQALLLQDDKSAMTLKQVDAIDPRNAEAYLEVAEQLASMRQYPRAAAMYQVAVERAPWWTTPRNGLGLLYTQSGDEDSARKVLDSAHTLDPFNYSTTNYLRLLDIMDKFTRKESAHFIVMYDGTQDPIIPEYFTDYLESVYPIVTGAFHYEPKVKTLIEVFPTHDEFAVRTTGTPWLPTVGASTGRIIALVAPRKGERTMGPFNWSIVLRHEFTHTVTLGATDNRIGHWFTEGLAVQQEHTPIRWEWVPMLYDAVSNGHLFPIDQLTWAFVRPKRPSDRNLAYAESSWICQYIEQTHGHQTILDMMDLYRQGKTEDDVFAGALHQSESEFMTGFEKWCRTQVAGWGYEELIAKKYEMLRQEGESLIQKRDFSGAIKVYEEIVLLRPVDILPHKRLAGLYKVSGQPELAAEQLAILAAVEVQSNQYCKATARAYRDIGNLNEAVKWAKRAVFTDPYDADAHKILAGIDEKLPDPVDLAREKRVMIELEHWTETVGATGDQTANPKSN